MFGGQALAIKAFILIIFIGIIAWVLYTFNFSLPKININIKQDRAPKRTKKTKSTQQDSDISKKISKARSVVETNDYHNTNEINVRPKQDTSILKSIIKQKVKDKLKEKEQPVYKQPTINFASDTPTFGISLLDSDLGKSTTINEVFLMEKAKALQNKLLEFNVPITIE